VNEVNIGLVAAFGAGIFSFLSPCVLPLVPSYLALVTGMSLEDLQEGVNRKATFIHSLLFVLGFSAIFIVMGASASFLGQFFRHYELWIARIGGVIIIIFGLHLSGVFKLAPLMRERRIHVNDTPAGYLGTIGVGMAFAAGWTPCLGPILGAILTYGMSQDTMWAGVGLLTAYSAGLAIPFLAASLALDTFLQGFKRFRRWIPLVEKASGVMLIGLGVLLLTGKLTDLTALLNRFTPDWIVNRL